MVTRTEFLKYNIATHKSPVKENNVGVRGYLTSDAEKDNYCAFSDTVLTFDWLFSFTEAWQTNLHHRTDVVKAMEAVRWATKLSMGFAEFKEEAFPLTNLDNLHDKIKYVQ